MDQQVSFAAAFNAEYLAKDEMNWDAYVEHYDLMCELNPAYEENIQLLLQRIPNWALPRTARICDIGAGTGNYIAALAKLFPEAEFFHVDFDSRMNELARAKYQRLGVSNVHFVEDHILHSRLAASSMDLAICVNSIYAVSPQHAALAKVRGFLNPTGRLFAIDFGRKQRTLDWAIYLFREAMKSGRVGKYARGLVEGREVMRQNRQSTKGQESGRYWLHSTDEFGTSLEQAGFIVDELFPCYRGYADMAVCRVRTT